MQNYDRQFDVDTDKKQNNNESITILNANHNDTGQYFFANFFQKAYSYSNRSFKIII